jgi:tetratricopeptide (TPR) repeat protein
LGDCDRAIAEFTAVLKPDRNMAAAYNFRGTAYYKNKDYDRADADFREAARVNPNYRNAYQNLVILHQEIGTRHFSLAMDYQKKADGCGEQSRAASELSAINSERLTINIGNKR